MPSTQDVQESAALHLPQPYSELAAEPPRARGTGSNGPGPHRRCDEAPSTRRSSRAPQPITRTDEACGPLLP